MIIKKKRINSLSCLNHVEEGKNLMMVLRDAARFKEILVKLGFSEDLIEGERVLPSMLNPTLKRNAEPFYISLWKISGHQVDDSEGFLYCSVIKITIRVIFLDDL